MNLFDEIKEEAKKYFSEAKGSHDWEHTERVLMLCLHIGEREGANMEVLELAAILHDIARAEEDKQNGRICHAEKGAELAKELLNKYELKVDLIDEVAHCIEAHRYRNEKIPATIEAKILFDADKLDAIGATGIGRAFLFAGEIGAKLHNHEIDIEQTKAYTKEDTAYREFMVKLKYLKDKMLTKEGKRLAQERHSFMTEFFERLNREVDGDA